MSVSQILGSMQHSYPASLINHIYWNTNTVLLVNKDTAIILLRLKSMPEIKDMYDRHPSITSITVITRRAVSIDFYWLIDTIDNVYVINIDSYRFIERFSDIDFYRLPRSRECSMWTQLTNYAKHEFESLKTHNSTRCILMLLSEWRHYILSGVIMVDY